MEKQSLGMCVSSSPGKVTPTTQLTAGFTFSSEVYKLEGLEAATVRPLPTYTVMQVEDLGAIPTQELARLYDQD